MIGDSELFIMLEVVIITVKHNGEIFIYLVTVLRIDFN